jgi:hypothetical protein
MLIDIYLKLTLWGQGHLEVKILSLMCWTKMASSRPIDSFVVKNCVTCVALWGRKDRKLREGVRSMGCGKWGS